MEDALTELGSPGPWDGLAHARAEGRITVTWEAARSYAERTGPKRVGQAFGALLDTRAKARWAATIYQALFVDP